MTDRMRFVGVSTASSSIMRIFPVWAEILGLDAELVGLDLPLDAPPSAYRSALREMREDPLCVGALVTTHKITLLDAARDLFDDLDPFAATVGEVSSIAFRGDRTIGTAKDPITVGLALAEMIDDDHFTTGGEVLCLGAGGAGTALGWHLAQRQDLTSAVTFVDLDQKRLAHLQSLLNPRWPDLDLRVVTSDVADVPALLAGLPPRSLVVNATGLGKDRPGSPVAKDAPFPEGAWVWELNYRGSLEFLHHARTQENSRSLTITDGWRYFIHGWTQVIADVFDLEMPPETVAELADAARTLP